MVETYAPLFIVEIEGKELPEDISRHIERLSYDDDEEKMDELKLTIADIESDLKLELVDHPQLQEGKEIRARWGYLGNLSEVRTFTIKEITYTFGEEGIARMEISALDKRHKLTGRSARTCWRNKKTEDVVKDVAQKHNLTPKVTIEEDITHEFLSQGGKNDMVFLNELAKDTGCSMWVTNNELHFEPNKVNEPVRKFRWREDQDGYLLSIRITSNAEEGKGTGRGTEVAGLDPLKKERIKETTVAKSSSSGTRATSLGDKPVSEKNSGGSSITEQRTGNETTLTQKNDEAGLVKATPAHTSAQARRMGKGKVQSASMKAIEATATTIGLPYLKAKDTITIENIGKKFSGDWRIKKVTHSISKSNYMCSLTLCRSDHNSSGGNKKNAGEAPKVVKNNNTAKTAGQSGASHKKPPRVVSVAEASK